MYLCACALHNGFFIRNYKINRWSRRIDEIVEQEREKKDVGCQLLVRLAGTRSELEKRLKGKAEMVRRVCVFVGGVGDVGSSTLRDAQHCDSNSPRIASIFG